MAGMPRVMSVVLFSAFMLKVTASAFWFAFLDCQNELVVPPGLQHESAAPVVDDLAGQGEREVPVAQSGVNFSHDAIQRALARAAATVLTSHDVLSNER
jgi:hypothetical protein